MAVGRLLLGPFTGLVNSGPAVARLFHRLLGLTTLVAFISLWLQLDVLVGPRGLLPIEETLTLVLARPELDILGFPSLFLLFYDPMLPHAMMALACGLCGMAILGFYARAAFFLLFVIYLSLVLVCRDFLSFQWDNLLLESLILGVFLPTKRPSNLIHFLFKLLLFKLYFESGMAKWQSTIGDWQDGTAMVSYYQTAPLPTALAHYFHHLPPWWHQLESWATLALELVVPWFIFGPRRLYMSAFVALTAFQVVNVLTANYGFFPYLALCLHVFLLRDCDLPWVGEGVAGTPQDPWAKLQKTLGLMSSFALLCLYVFVSLDGALLRFTPQHSQLSELSQRIAPFRAINTYHLFSQITTQRVEAEFQVFDGRVWQPLVMHHKPGDVFERPGWIAPHQPRVDFRLWFYGFVYDRAPPLYVRRLLGGLCESDHPNWSLFQQSPVGDVVASRVVFWDYQFSSPEERGGQGLWWKRLHIRSGPSHRCR